MSRSNSRPRSTTTLSLLCAPLLLAGCPFDPGPMSEDAEGSSSGTSSGDDPSPPPPGTSGADTTGLADDTGGSSSSSDDGSQEGSGTGAPPDQPPTAEDDGPYAIGAGQVLEVDAAQGALANDVDPEGAPLTITEVQTTTEEGGWVMMAPDGAFSYLPPMDLAYGTDRFQYTVEDDEGNEDSAWVRVVVQPTDGVVGLDEVGSKGLTLDGIDIGDQSGISVRGVGDVDGDGFDDLLVGAHHANPNDSNDAGEVYLVLGGPEPLESRSLADADVRFEGIDATDYAGHAVSGAGDVNGDGYADLFIGSHGGDPNVGNAGESYLVFGGPELPPVIGLADADVRFDGRAANGYAGWALDGPGDVNGDGFDDLLISAYGIDLPGIADVGETYLVFGGASLPSVINLTNADVRFNGLNASDLSGYAASGAGDVDGDGYADLLIGAYGGDPSGLSSGETYLVFGGPALPAIMSLADADVRIDGLIAGDNSGRSVQAAGDVDGDGYDDLLVGAHLADPNGPTSGEAYLVRGGPGLPEVLGLANADVRFEGTSSGDIAGYAVAPAGDVDGDGHADLLIGAPEASPAAGAQAGEVALVLGGPGLPPVVTMSEADLRFEGNAAGDRAGVSVHSAGDFNGDGFDDLLVGAYGTDISGLDDAGQTHLILGDDLRAQVTVLGGPLDDDLSARNGLLGDIVIGGRGHDTLHADGGPDVLRGGQGDDTLVVFDSDVFRLDGGLGYDTLELGAGLQILPEWLRARVTDIEAIQLSADGTSLLTISELMVLSLSSTSNTLTIEGDADDGLVVTDGEWFGPLEEDGLDLYVSTMTPTARLRVSPWIDVTFL